MVAQDELIAGKYRLVEPLGTTETVWKAIHETLQTAVAVKLVHRARGEDATKRFLAEAKAAGAVRHHNVVDIIDFGTTESGEPYMVLEYLVGETLRQRLVREPPPSATEIADIVAHALSGLAAVHASGIVHRDLRPENIFLVAEADGAFAKLLDFGVSKLVGGDAERSALTLDGQVLGAPEYIAPEQAGGSRDVDARADLFSAGVILYEALIGRGPFEGQTFRDLLLRDASTVPRVAALRPELGTALSDVIARAMAHDREDRFPDARTMRQALLEALVTIDPEVRDAPGPARGSIALPRASAVAQAPKSPARKRSMLPIAIGGGALVIAAGAIAVQLAVTGGWPALLGLARPADNPGAIGEIAPPDGGIVAVGETSEITLRNVPPHATLHLGPDTWTPAEVDAHRSSDNARWVIFTVPRGPAIELRVEVPGRRPWSTRASTESDAVVRAHLPRSR